jgi:GNAT superfamily N-acetyltransferase
VTAFRLRLATVDDAQAMARATVEAFEGYRAFAPPGWSPPTFEAELGTLRQRLGEPDVWALVGERRGALAGHVAFLPALRSRHPLPARRSRRPPPAPSLAHLWQLFVRPPYWGSGLATQLHAAAVAEAARRGFSEIRLYTPAGQARARRFYEREGWSAAGPPQQSPSLGLPLVEYRRPLSRAA